MNTTRGTRASIANIFNMLSPAASQRSMVTGGDGTSRSAVNPAPSSRRIGGLLSPPSSRTVAGGSVPASARGGHRGSMPNIFPAAASGAGSDAAPSPAGEAGHSRGHVKSWGPTPSRRGSGGFLSPTGGAPTVPKSPVPSLGLQEHGVGSGPATAPGAAAPEGAAIDAAGIPEGTDRSSERVTDRDKGTSRSRIGAMWGNLFGTSARITSGRRSSRNSMDGAAMSAALAAGGGAGGGAPPSDGTSGSAVAGSARRASNGSIPAGTSPPLTATSVVAPTAAGIGGGVRRTTSRLHTGSGPEHGRHSSAPMMLLTSIAEAAVNESVDIVGTETRLSNGPGGMAVVPTRPNSAAAVTGVVMSQTTASASASASGSGSGSDKSIAAPAGAGSGGSDSARGRRRAGSVGSPPVFVQLGSPTKITPLAPSPDAVNGVGAHAAYTGGFLESPDKRPTGLPPRRPSSSPHAAATAAVLAMATSSPGFAIDAGEGGAVAGREGKVSPVGDVPPAAPAMFISHDAGAGGAPALPSDGGVATAATIPGLAPDAGGSSGDVSAREREDHVMPLRDEGRHASLGATTTTTNVQDASSRSAGSQHTLFRGASDHMTTLHSPDSDRSMHTSSRTQNTAGGDSTRGGTEGDLTPTHARPPPSPADAERAALLARTGVASPEMLRRRSDPINLSAPLAAAAALTLPPPASDPRASPPAAGGVRSAFAHNGSPITPASSPGGSPVYIHPARAIGGGGGGGSLDMHHAAVLNAARRARGSNASVEAAGVAMGALGGDAGGASATTPDRGGVPGSGGGSVPRRRRRSSGADAAGEDGSMSVGPNGLVSPVNTIMSMSQLSIDSMAHGRESPPGTHAAQDRDGGPQPFRMDGSGHRTLATGAGMRGGAATGAPSGSDPAALLSVPSVASVMTPADTGRRSSEDSSAAAELHGRRGGGSGGGGGGGMRAPSAITAMGSQATMVHPLTDADLRPVRSSASLLQLERTGNDSSGGGGGGGGGGGAAARTPIPKRAVGATPPGPVVVGSDGEERRITLPGAVDGSPVDGPAALGGGAVGRPVAPGARQPAARPVGGSKWTSGTAAGRAFGPASPPLAGARPAAGGAVVTAPSQRATAGGGGLKRPSLASGGAAAPATGGAGLSPAVSSPAFRSAVGVVSGPTASTISPQSDAGASGVGFTPAAARGMPAGGARRASGLTALAPVNPAAGASGAWGAGGGAGGPASAIPRNPRGSTVVGSNFDKHDR
jgi:hypothetical protein